MMKERQVILISSKHTVLRTVLFAAAFVIAVSAVCFGLISYSQKSPGWQEASATLDRELPNFSRGFHTLVYMEGSSSEIRQNLNVFNKIYTDNLKRVYKLLDSENTYEGYANIAYLNNNFGKKVKVSTDLYSVLQDAYEKTLKGTYNLFAGPKYQTRIVLENAESFDSAWENERLEKIDSYLNDLSNFKVEFFPDSYVLIDVSEQYKAFLDEYEFNTPILDLGENYYFYKTVMMDQALADNGYKGCLFYAE